MYAAGIARAFLPRHGVHDLSARSFNPAGCCASNELDLVIARVDFAGRQLFKCLTKDFDAFDDLEGAHQEAGADVTGRLDRYVELKFRVSSVRRGATKILRQTRSASCGSDHAAGESFFLSEYANTGAARTRRGTGGEDGDNGVHHLALKLVDHRENSLRVFNVAVDAADAVH